MQWRICPFCSFVILTFAALAVFGCQTNPSDAEPAQSSMQFSAKSASSDCGAAAIEATEEGDCLSSYAKPGFVVSVEDGRLWILRPGEKKAEKHITLVGAGPNGKTIKALSKETALLYLATKPGFVVDVDDEGRIWVFRDGENVEKQEKHVTRVGSGPRGTTLKALDRETLDAYLAVGDDAPSQKVQQ